MKRRLAYLAVALAAAGAIVAVALLREMYRPYQGYAGNVVLVIEPRTRAREVAALLAGHGVLAHRLPLLLLFALGRARHQQLRAGEYLFDRPLRPIDVYRKLAQGDVYLHPVVIPEGSNRFDMARIFHEQLGLDPEALLRVTRQTPLIRDLDPQAPTLEGYLFPDTYRFPRDVTAARVVETMVTRFRHVLESKFRLDVLTSRAPLHDVVTLASLVEKETPDPNERPVVAGVFARRLEKKWLLACDPTVVYAARLDHRMLARRPGPITKSDLLFDSPYNTYRHAGLPPGPIASPGEASIRAAFHPDGDDFLYFVSNNHGGHLFARTLAEHQRNVARYRRQVAELRRAVPEEANSSEPASPRKSRGGGRASQNSAKRAKHQE